MTTNTTTIVETALFGDEELALTLGQLVSTANR